MIDLAARRARVLQGIDVVASSGLEIGPLNNPVVAKDLGPVRYVDFASTEALRAKPYDSTIDPADIVAVDIVWGERRLRDAAEGPVDYIVASHVIEHVPDLIGWLQELSEALSPDGVLSLVVPDKRFTFDLHRHTSTIGEALEAYLREARTPSIRQVVDSCHAAVIVSKEEAWAADWSAASLPKLVGDQTALRLAYDQARRIAQSPEYIDSHCWVFTPTSFLELLDLLAQLKLLPFAVRSFHSTEFGEFEFFAQLTPADPSDAEPIRASIARFRTDAEPSQPRMLHADLQARIAALEASASWRVTAPLRWLKRRLTPSPGRRP